jgi:hypothetical protein
LLSLSISSSISSRSQYIVGSSGGVVDVASVLLLFSFSVVTEGKVEEGETLLPLFCSFVVVAAAPVIAIPITFTL